jgi:hypothetical protein
VTPPVTASEEEEDIMFSVIGDGPGRYRLGNATGADAGWIRGRAIGFRGLRTEAEAIVAASAGWRALQRFLHREYAGWRRPDVDWERLRFVNDGAHEWVSDGRIPLARVCRARGGAACSGGERLAENGPARGMAVEFVVPSWLRDGAVVPLARELWHVLVPLLVDASHTTHRARHAASREWLPESPAAAIDVPDELLVG